MSNATLTAVAPITAEVATIIREQIGQLALWSVGARGYMHDSKSLYFDAKPRHRIVRVVVTLDPSDTYTVRVINRRTHDVMYEISGVYNDMLSDIIRELPEHV